MPSPPTTPRSIRTTPAFPPAPKLARAKLKSSSLDHEIFLTSHRKLRTLHSSSSVEWHQLQHQTSIAHTIPRTGSTSSLASSIQFPSSLSAANSYQDFKLDIINQGKCLCSQYIRARLRRAGVLNRKAMQRLRCMLEPSSEVVYEVFPALNSMGEELERMHPRVYTNVSRQLSRAPYGELVDSDTAPMLLNLVAKELFSRSHGRERITWAKIISVYAVCGGFAIDCVRQGHYEYLQFLIDSVGDIIEDDLVQWLAERGGWLGLQHHIRPKGSPNISFLDWLTLFVAISASLYVMANFIKHIGCNCYSLLF